MLIIKCNSVFRQVLAGALAILASAAAHGEGGMYKWKDANGHWIYSNINPPKNATRLTLEPLTTIPAPRPKTTVLSPAGFPKVDGDTQKKRDDTRRKILEDELAAEEKLLADARKSNAKGEVELHEKNVDALKKELANLK